MGEGFQKLIVWQKGYGFALEVYKATKTFLKEERFGMVSQIKRAAISISANIAEGYERRYRKEYVQFLMIAKGSLGEVETYLMFARDLGYFEESKYQALEKDRQEVGRLLRGLINSLM